MDKYNIGFTVNLRCVWLRQHLLDADVSCLLFFSCLTWLIYYQLIQQLKVLEGGWHIYYLTVLSNQLIQHLKVLEGGLKCIKYYLTLSLSRTIEQTYNRLNKIDK